MVGIRVCFMCVLFILAMYAYTHVLCSVQYTFSESFSEFEMLSKRSDMEPLSLRAEYGGQQPIQTHPKYLYSVRLDLFSR